MWGVEGWGLGSGLPQGCDLWRCFSSAPRNAAAAPDSKDPTLLLAQTLCSSAAGPPTSQPALESLPWAPSLSPKEEPLPVAKSPSPLREASNFLGTSVLKQSQPHRP